MRRVRVTIVAVEKQKYITYSECVFVNLRYPVCDVHVSYCHLWPVQFYKVLLHYLINGTIFLGGGGVGGELLNIKCVL